MLITVPYFANAYLPLVVQDYKQNFIPLLRTALRIWTKDEWENRVALREGYRRHYAHIREIVPKDQLLIFNPKDGWGPLCEFLRKPQPKGEKFPLIDESATASSLHSNVFVKQKFKGVVQKLVTILVPLLILTIAIWQYLPEIQERVREYTS